MKNIFLFILIMIFFNILNAEVCQNIRPDFPECTSKVCLDKLFDKSIKACKGCYFSNVDLRSINIIGKDLTCSNFKKAKLLVNSKLDGVKFNNADLQEANLNRASLKNTEFKKANLEGADLSFTNLSGADLTDAKVDKSTDLNGANMEGATWIDGTKCKDKTCGGITKKYAQTNK